MSSSRPAAGTSRRGKLLGSQPRGLPGAEEGVGAWGAGPFDNDAAEAWLGALKQAAADGTAAALLRTTIEPLADPALGLIDAEEAGSAIAAAAVIAALLGRPGTGMPAPVRAWLERQESLRAAASPLQPIALAVVARVKAASELHFYWEAAGHLEEFEAALDELHGRLRAKA